jgi:hypothetical protein
MTKISTAAAAASLAALLVASLAGSAAARDRYVAAGYAPRYVVAESHWGKGTVTGAVRRGRTGWQVQLPRGTWIDCGRNCTDTLRRATVDFWEAQGGPQAKDSGPGYFRWEFRY